MIVPYQRVGARERTSAIRVRSGTDDRAQYRGPTLLHLALLRVFRHLRAKVLDRRVEIGIGSLLLRTRQHVRKVSGEPLYALATVS